MRGGGGAPRRHLAPGCSHFPEAPIPRRRRRDPEAMPETAHRAYGASGLTSKEYIMLCTPAELVLKYPDQYRVDVVISPSGGGAAVLRVRMLEYALLRASEVAREYLECLGSKKEGGPSSPPPAKLPRREAEWTWAWELPANDGFGPEDVERVLTCVYSMDKMNIYCIDTWLRTLRASQFMGCHDVSAALLEAAANKLDTLVRTPAQWQAVRDACAAPPATLSRALRTRAATLLASWADAAPLPDPESCTRLLLYMFGDVHGVLTSAELELAFRELPARVVVHYLGLDELSTTTEDEVVMLIVRWMSNAYPNRFDIADDDDDVVDDEDFLTFQGAVVKTSMHVRAGLLSPEFREPHLRMLRAKQHAWEYRRGDRGKTDQALALAARPPRPSPSSELHAYLHRPRTGTTSSCPPELVLQLHTHRDNLVAGCNLAGPDVVWRGSEWRVKMCQSTDGDMLVLVYRTHPCTKTVMPVYADMYLHFGDATKAEKLTYDCMTGRGYGCGAWDQVDATLARLGWSAPADGSVCLHVRLVVL